MEERGNACGEEFDRLISLFREMSLELASEWMSEVERIGVLPEVRELARLYAEQNQVIHEACQRCRPSMDCPLERRELDWILSGGPERFVVQDSCGFQGSVSPEAWGAFAFLLVASEHARERAKTLGYKPHIDTLFDESFLAWQERLARRFEPFRLSRT